jgi:ketosteroid isomerase-like protein
MRYLTLGAMMCFFTGTAVQAQAPDPQVMEPITKFVESFNKGDVAAAAATHAADADLTIIDEVSPYLWRGKQAFQSWAADLEADAKKRGATDQKVALRPATRVETNGREAYVVVPATFTFKEGGVPMRASAQMSVVLKKGATGWLIHGWAWTGPKAQKAPGAATK